MAQAGKVRPYKLFAFGNSPFLRAYTNNDSSGVVSWTFHVVPIVKNSAGQPIVFDAALSPCRPLPYKDWLALLVDSMSSYDDIGSGNGVTLADSWAFNPDSPVTGETPHKWETRSLNDETFLVTEEWLTQSQLGRDPNVVLGATPPWSGYACLSTFPVDQFTVLSSTGTRTLTATCPFATVNVGGGYDIDPGVRVSKDARNGNGWDVTGTNTGTGFGSLSSEAICLQGAPSNASIATIQGNVAGIANNSFGTSTAACSSGTLVGGGYTTSVSGTPANAMRIYSNQRSTVNNNTWQVSAYNLTGATKNVTAFAYCLQGTSYTTSQVSASIDAAGNALPTCAASKVPMSGGWSFPRGTAYTPWNDTTSGGVFQVSVSPAPGGSGDPASSGYGECLAHP